MNVGDNGIASIFKLGDDWVPANGKVLMFYATGYHQILVMNVGNNGISPIFKLGDDWVPANGKVLMFYVTGYPKGGEPFCTEKPQ
ncbi:hypothetical protein AVEN_15551-1 [Araneus ventricosus]|nr:hypothetical protein AVEN_15551-1 [Araneus ventricosus]